MTIALLEDTDGVFDIKIEDGVLVEESIYDSIIKHNFYSFGRLDKNTTSNPILRNGDSVSFLEEEDVFSRSWLYYMEGNVTFDAVNGIISEFNKACDRDFNNGLIDQRIRVFSGSKLDKNSLLFKIAIGESIQEFEINI